MIKQIRNICLGPVRGMKCTYIVDHRQPLHHTWLDNFLCVPKNSSYNFEWSQNGPINGKYCIEWIETADPNWNNNYLCADKV